MYSRRKRKVIMIKNLENYYSEDKENYNILNMIYTIIL